MAAEVQSLPIGVALLILASGAVGCLLVFAGQRLLAATLAVAGAVLGGVLGAAIGEVLFPALPTWAFAAGFALLGALFGALSSRLAAAAALAAILGITGALSVTSAERHGWIGFAARDGAPPSAKEKGEAPALPPSAPAPAIDLARDGIVLAVRRDVSERVARMSSPLRTPAVEANLGALQAMIADGWAGLISGWNSSVGPVRTLMLACGAMCGFLGLCLGLLASRWTAAFVTALVGALVVMLAIAAGAQQIFGDPTTLPGSRAGWLLGWGLLAMCGTAVQWFATARPRPATAA